MNLLGGILNKINPERKNQVRIIKERRNNTLRLYEKDGKPTVSDEIINLPNFRYFMETYNNNKIFNEIHSDEIELSRESVLWRNPEADSYRPGFLQIYRKKKNNDFGTIFPEDQARKIVNENEFFKYHAKDFKTIFEYVNVNKRVEIEELSEDAFVAPPLGYSPDHIEKGSEEYEKMKNRMIEDGMIEADQ